MFRSFRPAYEKLEKREVFSAGPMAGLPLFTDLGGQGMSEGEMEVAVTAPTIAESLTNNSWGTTHNTNFNAIASGGTSLPGVYLAAVPASQAPAIPLGVFKDNLYLKAAPESEPSAAADFDDDGDVDGADFLAARSAHQHTTDSHSQALLGRGDGTFQSQIKPEIEDANDVNNLTAESHDAVFEEMGRTGGEFLGLARQHPSVLIGLLLP
jgi:hypothetical protein